MEKEYKTLSQALRGLKEKGYSEEFEVNLEETLETSEGNLYYPHEVKVNEFHQFESEHPSRNSSVYAVETEGGEKGLLIEYHDKGGGVRIAEFLRRIEMGRQTN